MISGFPPRHPSFEENIPLSELSSVVIDSETTGLYPNQGDEIIELAGIYIDGFSVQPNKSFQTLVNPRVPICENAFKIHGISDDELKKEPFIEDILPSFISFLDNRVVVGQNIAFDLSFLDKSMKKSGLVKFGNMILDTRWISKLLFPNVKSHNLDVIASRLKIKRPENRHRAMGDVLLTSDIYVRLLQRCVQAGYTKIGDIIVAYENFEKGKFGDKEVYRILEECFFKNNSIDILYENQYQKHQSSMENHIRQVDIYHFSPPYFVGYCHLRNTIRTFRVDRVIRVIPKYDVFL